MKLYKYTFGDLELYGPANDDADAYERRVDIDHQFHYVPVMIEEVKLEGYEIVVSPLATSNAYLTAEDIKAMDKKTLQSYLTLKDIPYHHALGEDKLRELLALQHI